MTVSAPPPSYGPAGIERLRNAAMRLAAELDEAGLFQAAAHVSMGGDALKRSPPLELSVGQLESDDDLEFEFDEDGRVWMTRQGYCQIISGTEAACRAMRKFLGTVALKPDG